MLKKMFLTKSIDHFLHSGRELARKQEAGLIE